MSKQIILEESEHAAGCSVFTGEAEECFLHFIQEDCFSSDVGKKYSKTKKFSIVVDSVTQSIQLYPIVGEDDIISDLPSHSYSFDELEGRDTYIESAICRAFKNYSLSINNDE